MVCLQCLTNILEQRYIRDLSKKTKTKTYILYYQTNNKLNSRFYTHIWADTLYFTDIIHKYYPTTKTSYSVSKQL